MFYGFKISMLFKYNLLLVTNLITCLLNVFVCVVFLNDFIPCSLQKNVFVLVKIIKW